MIGAILSRMPRFLVACLLCSSFAASAEPAPTLPPALAGRPVEVMQAVYPKWNAGAAATGGGDAARPEHARLLESRGIDLGGRRGIVALTITWLGDSCEGDKCPPVTGDVALLDRADGHLRMLAVVRGTLKCGRCTFDSESRRFDWSAPLIGVDERTVADGTETTSLVLFRVNGATLEQAFTRRVEWRAGTCKAIVASDDVDAPPFPLRVTDTCRSGRTATEIWRWSGGRYQLHGPPSDADEPDPTASDERAE